MGRTEPEVWEEENPEKGQPEREGRGRPGEVTLEEGRSQGLGEFTGLVTRHWYPPSSCTYLCLPEQSMMEVKSLGLKQVGGSQWGTTGKQVGM